MGHVGNKVTCHHFKRRKHRKKKSIHQELEREACEELQREDGLRSPSGVEFTLLDVPGGRVDVLRAL